MVGQALALAASSGLDVVVAPVLAYGYRSRPLSGGGQGFPGTVSLRGATLTQVIVDIVNEFRRTGFRKIVLLAHHMENQNWIYEAAYESVGLHPSDGARAMIIESPYPEWSPELSAVVYPDGPPPFGTDHAAIVETSLMMHVRPDLVRTDLIADDAPPRLPGYDLMPIPEGFTAASGVLSRAEGASREIGQRCFDEIATYLHGMIRDALFTDADFAGVPVAMDADRLA